MGRYLIAAGLALGVITASGTAAAQNRGSNTRFPGMDRNNDGVIARAEWQGSDRSFSVHDWNRDGVLSGEEVRPGGRRTERQLDDREFDSADREYEFDDWTVRGFNSLDHNRDSRIVADEWHFDRESFRRADHNGDGILTRAEFLNETTPVAEVVGTAAPADLFTSTDVNRDGTIARDEWHWSLGSFDRLDTNRDGRLNRGEFSGDGSRASRDTTYKSGYDRGLMEGRAAGRQDRERNQGWDLEGQRELEQADSGYQPAMGARTDYQSGYRDGFRRAYREGFGPVASR